MWCALNYSLINKRALFRGSTQFQSIINVPTRCSSSYSNIILYEYLRRTSAVHVYFFLEARRRFYGYLFSFRSNPLTSDNSQ